MKYSKIKTADQYKAYFEEYHFLRFEKKGDHQEELELLALLMNEYESRVSGKFYSSLNPVELIRFMLYNNEISQNQLAEDIQISKQLLSDILNYRRNISKKVVLKLSGYFSFPQEMFSKKYDLNSNKEQMKKTKEKYRSSKSIQKDDLTVIEGVDDNLQNIFNNANVYTYEDLSNMDESKINSMVSEAKIGYEIDAFSLKSQSSYASLTLKGGLKHKKETIKDKIAENMSLKDRIKYNLELINNPNFLTEILEFIMPYTSNNTTDHNIKSILSFAGSFSKEDAANFHYTINSEFNKIDGEW